MKKCDLLSKSISLERKTFLLSLVLLCILLTCAFICYSVADCIPQVVEKQKTTNLNARLLFVSPKDLSWEKADLEYLHELEHVELVFSQEEGYIGTVFETEKDAFSSKILGAKGSMLPENIIAGKTTELADYEILIPSKIVLLNGKTMKGTDLLNKSVFSTVESKVFTDSLGNLDRAKSTYITKEFQVVGVYDVTERVYMENQIFTTMETSRQLHQISDGNKYDYMDPPVDMMILVDNYKNALTLESQLNASGYFANVALSFDYTLLYGIQFVALLLCCITIVLSLFILLFVFMKTIQKKQTDIGLLKVIGYDDIDILKLVSIENVKLFLMALILVIISYSILFPSINAKLFSTAYLPIFSMRFVLSVFIFSLFMLGTSAWTLSRMLKKIVPIEILKDVNE